MHMKRLLRLTPLSLALGAAVAASACQTPKQQQAVAQALNDAADQIGTLRGDVDQLQSDLDSLRIVVAYQDTMITRLAALNSVPVLRPPTAPVIRP